MNSNGVGSMNEPRNPEFSYRGGLCHMIPATWKGREWLGAGIVGGYWNAERNQTYVAAALLFDDISNNVCESVRGMVIRKGLTYHGTDVNVDAAGGLWL